MSRPIYAIGDSHGQLRMLEHALELIDKDGGAGEVIFLGDYVDRGPDSCGVLEMLIQGRSEGRHWTPLKGNHDRMFRRFLHNGTIHDRHIKTPGLDWLHPRLGGVETLASYGVRQAARSVADILDDAMEAVPRAHIDFIDGLDLYAERGGLFFVHAGIAPEVPLPEQTEDDLVWIREPFLSFAGPHPWLVVHGHTALEAPTHFGNRVDLDGGSGYGRPLHPTVFEGGEAFVLTGLGRVPLVPAATG